MEPRPLSHGYQTRIGAGLSRVCGGTLLARLAAACTRSPYPPGLPPAEGDQVRRHLYPPTPATDHIDASCEYDWLLYGGIQQLGLHNLTAPAMLPDPTPP